MSGVESAIRQTSNGMKLAAVGSGPGSGNADGTDDDPWCDPQPPPDSPTAAAGPPRMPPELASGYPNRVAGCLLGKMCGDVLGAGVEGWAAEDVLLSNPEGLTDFLHTERGYGCYTDDSQMAIALARSLLVCGGRIDDVNAARCYAEEYQPVRGYGGTAYKILSGIQRSGIDAESIRTIGTKFIPNGSFGNGGAMRIAPLGLVYRHAPPTVLREAVAAALRCTHVHPVAIDGAFVIALAVGYLSTRQPEPAVTAVGGGTTHRGTTDEAASTAAAAATSAAAESGSDGSKWRQSSDDGGGSSSAVATDAADAATSPAAAADAAAAAATPVGLLDYLLSHGAQLETEGMALKLRTVRAVMLQAPQFKGPDESWSQYLASPGWAAELRLQSQIAESFQIRADDAAAAALAALCFHWQRPEDAVVAAVHYGGDTDTVAAITGALAGSLYGTQWLPARWFNRLENGAAGRDEVVALAARLALLDTRD